MNQLKSILKNDFRNYLKYNILHILIAISILFAGTMAFIPGIDPLIFIFTTTFILPVIVFSTSFFIEKEEQTLTPKTLKDATSIQLILARTLSALILMLIPFILYVLVMVFILNMSINVFLFFLVYLLASVMHVIVGTTLAIISKSTQIMSISYVGYIVLFSLIPFFYANGLIPNVFQYVLIISPAYLSGILFQEIYYGYAFSPMTLIILAVVLQFIYIFLLTFFIVRPYFKSYLLFTMNEGDKGIS
ncbi:MAG: ABC transporter permease [Bacilli bacterium]|nr:ABC transporter permease [Bacilli bacterium]MBN2877521.1 ABC transporter permease [Bacilli bacterium]